MFVYFCICVFSYLCTCVFVHLCICGGKFTEMLRMTPLAALLILDQLPKVEAKIEALNRNYSILEAKLGGGLVVIFPDSPSGI